MTNTPADRIREAAEAVRHNPQIAPGVGAPLAALLDAEADAYAFWASADLPQPTPAHALQLADQILGLIPA